MRSVFGFIAAKLGNQRLGHLTQRAPGKSPGFPFRVEAFEHKWSSICHYNLENPGEIAHNPRR
jgi:hypothetical protein